MVFLDVSSFALLARCDMNTVADFVMARMLSLLKEVLAGREPRAMRDVRERGRRRSSTPMSSDCCDLRDLAVAVVGDFGSAFVVLVVERMDVSPGTPAVVVVVGDEGVGKAVLVVVDVDFLGGMFGG